MHNHTQQLDSASNRLDKLERRIMVEEVSLEDTQAHTFTLEKQVSMLTEHMDDLENRPA